MANMTLRELITWWARAWAIVFAIVGIEVGAATDKWGLIVVGVLVIIIVLAQFVHERRNARPPISAIFSPASQMSNRFR